MNKTYISPTIEVLKMRTVNLCATSIQVKDEETDDEARSRKFWGPSPFEIEDDEQTTSY